MYFECMEFRFLLVWCPMEFEKDNFPPDVLHFPIDGSLLHLRFTPMEYTHGSPQALMQL